MDIDKNAPAIATGVIDIAATPQAAWSLVSSINDWPLWNPAVKSAELQGELAAGTQFKWKAGPGSITSTLESVDEPREIGWSGRTMGIRALHVYRIEPTDAGCRVHTEESWSGIPVRLLRGRMQKMLQEAIDAGLQHLKTVAENPSA